MSVTLRAGSGASDNSAPTSLVPILPAGTAKGDLTLIFVECTNVDVLYGAATGGWVKIAEHQNFLNTNLAGVIYGRVWSVTPAAPTVTFADGNGAGGSISWSAISFTPGAGGTLGWDNTSDAGRFAANGTSMPVNALTATASEVASVIFSGQRSNTTNTATIGSTMPTGWTQPTGVSRSTTFPTTTAGSEQLGTNIGYRLTQTGTVAPGNVVMNRDASSSIWHILIKETLPATNLTATAALTGSGTLTATATTTDPTTAAVKAIGTIVDGGSAATSITLPVPAGAAAGDYLVAVLYNSVGTSASDWAMGSTGFARIGPAFIATDAAQRTGGLYGQRLTGAPPASYTFTTPDSSSTRNVGVIIALSNVHATTPVSASTAWAESNTSATSLAIPGGGTAGDLTLEYIAADFTAGNTYAGAPNASGPLDLQAALISPAGTENTAVARTMVRVYAGIAPTGGVPTVTFSTTAPSSHRAAFLISFKSAGAVTGNTPTAALSGAGTLAATVTGRTGGTGTSMTAYLTGYGYPDNDPANSDAIAYPNAQHAVAGGTGTYSDPISMATAITTTGGGSIVPTKVLAGYLEGWSSFGSNPPLAKEGPAILPRNINSNYNALMVAFATVASNGTATFAPEQNVANLKTDIAAWKAAGKVILLSVGGAGGSLSALSTTTQQNNFLSSIKSIIDAYGFQGIDWDLEVGGGAPTPSVSGMTAITNNLVATYGSSFLVTMAPYGSVDSIYQQLANAILPNLTWINYQFYNLNANPTAADIKSKIAAWMSAVPGLTASQFMVGFMTTTDDNLGLRFPYNQLQPVFDSVEATYPTVRGSFIWGINEDWSENYQYATTIAPAVQPTTGGTGGTSTPEWAAGTMFYAPVLRRYFRIEDACAGCSGTRPGGTSTWLDLWVGGKTGGYTTAQTLAVEDALTGAHTVIKDPPSNYAVVTGDIVATGFTNYGETPVTASSLPAVSTLTDTFATADSAKWNGYVTGTSVVAGQLQIVPTTAYPGLGSAASYSLRNSSVSVEVPGTFTATPNNSNEQFLQFFDVAGNALAVFISGGNLAARSHTAAGNVYDDAGWTTYNATTMRYWRLRHDGTNILFEYSADRSAWTVLRTLTTWSTDIDSGQVALNAGFYNAGDTATGTAVFDNLNTSAPALSATAALTGSGALATTATTPKVTRTAAATGSGALAATVGTPKTSSLTDDFTTANASKWTGIDGTNVLVTGGQLRVNTTPSYYNAASARTYDLTGSSMSVEVAQVPNLGNGSTSAYFSAYVSAGNSAQIFWQGGTLYAAYTVGGTLNSVAVTYSPVAHRFWRIREAAGTLYWEASASGASWTALRAPVATPLSLTSVFIIPQSGYYGTESSPGYALFDNVNLPPTPTVPGSPRTFYVDPAGSDANNGISTGTAWATPAKVTSTPLYPGDQVLFKRGSTFTGNVTISDSGTSTQPITIGAYGTGTLPIISGGGASGVAGTVKPCEVYGSWVVLDSIEFRGSSNEDVFVNGADVTVQGCAARWGSYGITQSPSAARIKVLYNTLTDINVGIIRPGANDDGGGSGVLLEGDAADVHHNVISGCFFTSPDYGVDGQALEIYGGTNATLHHNYVTECMSFAEIGNPASNNNTYYDNVFVSSLAGAAGFAIHGALYDDGVTPDPFGPVLGTKAYHNTIVLTGGDAAAIGVWVSPNGEVDLRNNIIVVSGSAKATTIGATNRTVTEAGNVYWSSTGGAAGTVVGLPAAMAASSIKADPLFVGAGDYRLRVGSPALDRGVTITGATITTDYAGKPRPQGTASDSGAYEGASLPLAETLVDAFTTQDGSKWTGWVANQVVWNARGTVDITLSNGYPSLTSAAAYQLTGSSVYVKPFSFPPANPDYSSEMYLTASTPTGNNSVGIAWIAGNSTTRFLYCREVTAGAASDAQVTYNPATMVYWRIREAAGTLYWETSQDAATWTVQRSKVSTTDWSSVHIAIDAGYWGTVTSPGIAAYDSVNVGAAPAFTTTAALTGSGALAASRATTVTVPRGVNNSDGAYNVKPDGVWGTFPGTYGTHWHYDAPASLTYLASRGIKSTRLAFAWERLQPIRGAALDSAEQARIISYLDACQAAGIRVVIEPHSYARYREGAYPTPGITVRTLGVDLTTAEMADLWTRMVAAFGSHPAVYGWELLNEPYGLPNTNLGSAFAATWDTTLSGWGEGATNCTIARSTSITRTGAGALQMTTTANTAGNTYAQAWFATGGATSLTFSAYVRSLGAARSAQFVVNWYDSSLTYITSTGHGFISATSTTWQQVAATITPPAGAYRGQLCLDVLGAQTGEVFLWDDLTSNALAVQTGAQLWEATSQTLVTAIRNAGDTRHVIYVPGYNWQDPRSWRESHPQPFVTDPAGTVRYSAHFYFDDSDDGTYAATYAQENANSIAQGYTSVTDRTVSSISRFADWCTQFGVAGAFTELGWPHNADATSWNATAEAVYSRLDQVNMDVWVWTTGEMYGTTSPLNPYDIGSGSTLSSANAQATVIEAHLGAASATLPRASLQLRGGSGATLRTDIALRTGSGTAPPANTAAAALAGSGALTATGTAARTTTAAGSGTGALTATTGTIKTAAAALSGSGGLVATSTATRRATAAVAGAGALAAGVSGNASLSASTVYRIVSGAWQAATVARL